jgi:LuxR family maltose regulon positive regulatory protein
MFSEFFTGSSEMVREWINELSRVRVSMPADLMLEYALALALIGALDDAHVWLVRSEAALPDDAPAVSRARVAIAYALTLGLRGDIGAAIDAAERARSLVEPGRDGFIDGALQQILLRGYIYTDDLLAARALYERSRPRPGDPEQLDGVILEAIFSQAELEAGALASALGHAEAAAAAMERLGAERHMGANEVWRTFGSLAYEEDRLDEAERLLERSVDVLQAGRPVFLLMAHLELARIWNARGDRESAFAELDRAQAALRPGVPSPLVDRVHAYRARLLAEGGDVASALAALTQLPDGRRRWIAEARCHLAEKNTDAARAAVDRLISSRVTGRDELDEALLHARIGLDDGADDLGPKLDRALDLGRSAGYLRTLADEGPALAAALADNVRHRPADAYGDKLAPILERAIAAAPARSIPLFAGVVLSERELTVLKYLATRLTTREIAAELYVSMNTLRTHTKSIYRKLGAESRAGAAEAARSARIL